MNPYPKGSYIVRDGDRRKILGELDELRFTSMPETRNENWETTAGFSEWHVEEIKRAGWKVEGEKQAEWPQKEDTFFYFDIDGEIIESVWTSLSYHAAIRDNLGIYKTYKEAQAAFEVAKAAIKGMKK